MNEMPETYRADGVVVKRIGQLLKSSLHPLNTEQEIRGLEMRIHRAMLDTYNRAQMRFEYLEQLRGELS